MVRGSVIVRVSGWTRRWSVPHWPVVPVTPVAVKSPIAIVISPITANDEADDWDTDPRAVGGHQHALVLVAVLEIVASDPATMAEGDHVAPFPSVGTALDTYSRAGRYRGDQWIVDIRAGAQVDICGDETVSCVRQQRQKEKQQSKQNNAWTCHVINLPRQATSMKLAMPLLRCSSARKIRALRQCSRSSRRVTQAVNCAVIRRACDR